MTVSRLGVCGGNSHLYLRFQLHKSFRWKQQGLVGEEFVDMQKYKAWSWDMELHYASDFCSQRESCSDLVVASDEHFDR